MAAYCECEMKSIISVGKLQVYFVLKSMVDVVTTML